MDDVLDGAYITSHENAERTNASLLCTFVEVPCRRGAKLRSPTGAVGRSSS
jgi:hypothetical protein